MDTRPGVSTAFIGTDDLRAKMKICRETGFSYLELSNIADDAQTYALLKDLAGAREETGLVI